MPKSEYPKNDLRNSQFGGGFVNADTVNAQRIGGDIWNFFFGQQLALFWQQGQYQLRQLCLR